MNDNKPLGTDLIPPKILTTLKEFISEPIEHIINSMISEGCFPDQAKISSSLLPLKRMTELLKPIIDQSVFYLHFQKFLKNSYLNKCLTILIIYSRNICQGLEKDMAVTTY